MTKNLFQIAALFLNFKTLETRNSDSLDFREVSVWGVKAALEAAYELGRATALEQVKDNDALLAAAALTTEAELQASIYKLSSRPRTQAECDELARLFRQLKEFRGEVAA